jgi:hypothetical protein
MTNTINNVKIQIVKIFMIMIIIINRSVYIDGFFSFGVKYMETKISVIK